MPLAPILSLPMVPQVPTSRCEGHCCLCFYIPYTPEELEARKRDIIDGEQIAEMVISLRTPDVIDSGLFYTCKHIQANGDCGIYQDRPRMCRDYPYKRACIYDGCAAKPIATV